MKVSGILTSNVQIEITPHEAINQLFLHYFKHKREELTKIDNKIYHEYDESIHGSPSFKLHFITDDEDMIKIYNGLVLAYEGIISKSNK